MNRPTALTPNTNWPVHIDKSGWYGKDVAKEDLVFQVGAEQLAAFDALLARINAAGTPLTSITRTMFSDPRIDEFLAAAVSDLKWGLGLVILRGMPVDAYSVDDLRKIYWGVGIHFGELISQSRAGDRMGDVIAHPNSTRGYTSPKELGFHTDPIEILSLLCVQRSKTGGENVFMSSLAIREVVERERPDLMPVLLRGFRSWRLNEQAPGAEPVTPYRVPVFGEKEGLKSCWMFIHAAEGVALALGEPLSDLEREAIAFVLEVCDRPEMGLLIQLERGEAVFMNNFEVLHSRQSFIQWEDPAKARHLLRLWCQSEPSRPLPDEMLVWHNPSGRQGIDPYPTDEASAQELVERMKDPLNQTMRDCIEKIQTELEAKRKAEQSHPQPV